MDDNTSIQFRLRLAQINGIKTNEKQLSETNHQRIDESIDHIKQALDRGNVAVRRNAVSHRLATPEHITQALKDKESYVRAAAINHHSATPEHITQALKDKEPAVRLLAIKHPKATPEHITQALKDKVEGVRLAALKHHNVTSEHITQALKDKSPAVRYDAITHRNATTEHLEQGMKDSDESIRKAADIIHKRDQQPITESHINEAYNPQGKITHFVPKDKLDNHKKEMGFQGFDVETKPLPKTHPDHETHIGIVSKTPTESSHHVGAGAKRFGAGFVMR